MCVNKAANEAAIRAEAQTVNKAANEAAIRAKAQTVNKAANEAVIRAEDQAAKGGGPRMRQPRLCRRQTCWRA